MSRNDRPNSENAGDAGVGSDASNVVELRQRVLAIEKELRELAELNHAIFPLIVGGDGLPPGVFAARFDRTFSDADELSSQEQLPLRTQGDFYVVRRIENSVYFVVGDATGHHARAGGLKLFAAVMLARIFDECERERLEPAPIDILNRLDQRFLVSAMADEAGGVSGGANMVVIRTDIAHRRISFASAGLPVRSLGRGGRYHGRFDEFNGVKFHQIGVPPRIKKRICRNINSEGISFLAIVTDGFHALARKYLSPPHAGDTSADEKFGPRRITQALRRGYTSPARPAGVFPATYIANELTVAAKRFRSNRQIPEEFDDHRLVVVIDLAAVWQIALIDSAAAGRPLDIRLDAAGPSGAPKKSKALTKCLP